MSEPIRELLDKASELPWSSGGPLWPEDVCRIRGNHSGELAQVWDSDDARLAVAAVNALPDLLAVVDAAQKVLPILDAHTQMLRTLPYESKARVHLREVDSTLRNAVARVTEGDPSCNPHRLRTSTVWHDEGEYLPECSVCGAVDPSPNDVCP